MAFYTVYIWSRTNQFQMKFGSHHTFDIYLLDRRWIDLCSHLGHIVSLMYLALCTLCSLHNFHLPKPFSWLDHNHPCKLSWYHLLQRVLYKPHNLCTRLMLLWFAWAYSLKDAYRSFYPQPQDVCNLDILYMLHLFKGFHQNNYSSKPWS